MLQSAAIRRIAGVLALATLGGCQAYQSQPLDMAAYRQEYLQRAADAPSVLQFAKRLASEEESPVAFDLADGLSLAEAEAVALFYNPDLRVARLRAGVAQATARTAGLWEDPTLGVDAERILSNVQHPWIIGGAVGITLPISGRLDAEKQRATAAGHAELQQVKAQEWAVRCDLRRAWMEWSAAAHGAAIQTELLARLDDLLKLVDRLEKAGEYTRIDARVFRIERVTRAADLELIQSKAAEAELHVRSLMGLSAAAPVRLVAATHHQSPQAADRRQAIETGNLEMAALKAEYEVAEATLQREIRAQYPDVTIGPGLKKEDGDDRALLGLSLPIPLWNRNQQGVAQALASRDLLRSQVQAGMERLLIALETAELRHRTAIRQRRTIETSVVPMVDEQEADTRRLAAAGRVDPLLILDALTRQHEARGRLLDSRVAESIALIRMDELTGPPQKTAKEPVEIPAPPK